MRTDAEEVSDLQRGLSPSCRGFKGARTGVCECALCMCMVCMSACTCVKENVRAILCILHVCPTGMHTKTMFVPACI